MERGVFVIFLGQMGFTSTQISILQVTFFVTCFLAEIPTGMLSDLLGRKSALAFGSLFMGLGVLLQYFAQSNFFFMLFAFVVHGTAFAFVSGAVTALLFDELKSKGQESRYASFYSIYNFLQGLGLAMAMALGGTLQENYSWKELYYLSAMLQGLSIVPVLFMKETKHGKDHEGTFLKGFLGEASTIVRIVIPISLIHAAMTPYFVFSQKFLKSFEIGIGAVGHIMAIVEFVASLAVVVFCMKPRPFGRKRTSALLLVFALLLISHSLVKLNFTGLLISVGLFLLSNTIVLFTSVTSNSYFQTMIQDSGKRATVMSFVSFVDTAAIGFGYVFYGITMDFFAPNVAIAMAAVFPLVSVILLLRGRKNVHV